MFVWLLLYAHRHCTDTSEPDDGNGAQNMVTVQSGFEPATFRSLAHELTNCCDRAHTDMLNWYVNSETIFSPFAETLHHKCR
jgi:hypothetical protein